MKYILIVFKFLVISLSFIPLPFIYTNQRYNGRRFFPLGVSAESTMLNNSLHYLPVPDIHSYTDSPLSAKQYKFSELEKEAFRRLHYIEPNAKEARVSLLFLLLVFLFFSLFLISFNLFFCIFRMLLSMMFLSLIQLIHHMVFQLRINLLFVQKNHHHHHRGPKILFYMLLVLIFIQNLKKK
jgi:hypothetical protein